MKKGIFIPDITVKMFKNATLEGVEELLVSGTMEDIEIPDRTLGEWIEIKTRKPTEEEIQEYMEDPHFDIDDPEDLIFFECQMPEDGQEVLITTSWGNVCIDTYVQEYGAFEDHEDHEDVVAWMPLPKPFKKEPEANDRQCEKCRHKVETKPGVEACGVWDCSFEPKDEQS